MYNQNNDGTMPAKQGAMTTADLDPYTRQAVYSLNNGIKVFAGPRLDPFYADVQGIFDLLNCCSDKNHPKPADGSMPYFNTLGGYNVHEIAIQIPVNLVAPGAVPIVGVWAAASRRAVEVHPRPGELNYTGGLPQSGPIGRVLPGARGNLREYDARHVGKGLGTRV